MKDVISAVVVNFSDIVANVGPEVACGYFPDKAPVALLEKMPTTELMSFCRENGDKMSISVLTEVFNGRLSDILTYDSPENAWRRQEKSFGLLVFLGCVKISVSSNQSRFGQARFLSNHLLSFLKPIS